MQSNPVRFVDVSDPQTSKNGIGEQFCTFKFKDDWQNNYVVYVQEDFRNFTDWANWYSNYGNDHTTQWTLEIKTVKGQAQLTANKKNTVCDADQTPVYIDTSTIQFGNGLFQLG